LISIFINYSIWLTFLCRIWVSIVQCFPSKVFLKQRLVHSSASAKTIPAFQHQTAATKIPWTGGQRRRLKRTKQSARTCFLLLKLLLIKKICQLNTLHLYPAKTNKERVTEFLYQAVELSTSNCSIFTENEDLVQIKVTITNHDVGPDYTLHKPKLHGSPPSELHCIETFFTVHDFWATCACPEKNRVALKIFTAVNILFTFRIFNSFRLPRKQSFPWIFFTVLNIFLTIQDFSATAFHLGKRRLPKWIYTVLKIFSPFTNFEQIALALKKQSCPEIFHCIEHTFYIQEFWATCVCPEKQSCPGIFHCIEYTFYIQDFWVTCA